MPLLLGESPQAVAVSDAELTIPQAARLLNVSHEFVVRLIVTGELSHHTVGAECRLLLSDVALFKQQADVRRKQALDELVAEAQAEDIGY